MTSVERLEHHSPHRRGRCPSLRQGLDGFLTKPRTGHLKENENGMAMEYVGPQGQLREQDEKVLAT